MREADCPYLERGEAGDRARCKEAIHAEHVLIGPSGAGTTGAEGLSPRTPRRSGELVFHDEVANRADELDGVNARDDLQRMLLFVRKVVPEPTVAAGHEHQAAVECAELAHLANVMTATM